jgi:PmbA protein
MIETAKDLFQELAKAAKADGAEVEMVVSDSESFSANYNRGELGKYSFDQSLSAGVRVLYGKGAGFSTTEKISKDSLLETYREALRSAKDLSKEAKAETEAQKLFKPSERPTAMHLVSGDIEKVPMEDKLAIARKLESVALEYDSKVQNVPYSRYGESKGRKVLMNSLGLDVFTEAAGISAFSYALSKHENDSKSGGFSSFVRKPHLLSAEKIAKEAAKRSLELLGSTQPKSGTYPVVLFNEVVSELIDFLIHHLSAKTLDEGTSLLNHKLEQKIISHKLTIVDDPFLTELGGARPFDSEGANSQKTTLIEKGTLKTYLTNSHLAEKLGLKHTANASRNGGEMGVAPSNTVIEAGTASIDELLKASNEMIYITAVDALHSGFNPTTLDFSLPAYGFLYKGGERVRPLHQMVVSGNLLLLLNNVENISRRYNQDGGSVLAPDMFIPEMSIAGQS